MNLNSNADNKLDDEGIPTERGLLSKVKGRHRKKIIDTETMTQSPNTNQVMRDETAGFELTIKPQRSEVKSPAVKSHSIRSSQKIDF